MKKIIIFGGTFNPIHNAHLRIARSLLTRFKPDKIIFIPANIPYHKSCAEVIDPKHRLKMVKLAIKDKKHFAISDLEVKRSGNTFSIDTIQQLKKKYPKDTEFYFVIGTDSLIDLPGWYKVNELAQLYRFITIARPGYPFARLVKGLRFPPDIIKDIKKLYQSEPKLDISSTGIRNRIKENKTIRSYAPVSVAQYIKKHKLYQ